MMIVIALIRKAFRRCRVSGDGFKLLKFGCRSLFYPDLARSAEKVSRSVNEGHGRVSEHREDMSKHPDIANSAFGNPSRA